jgi:hypothetical protein
MAILPKIVYNFNENSATTIRDYSENGNDGTGVNLTIASSTRVGNDAVFNSTSDQIDLGNITDLNGVSDCAIHLGVKFNAGAGTLNVLSKSGQISGTYNYTTNVLNFRLSVNSGLASVDSGTLVIDQFYDFDLVYVGDVLTLYQDGVSVGTDATESGVVDTSANTMYIGGSSNSANFLINEFKLYDEDISITIIAAVIAEQNGLLSDNGGNNTFALGDIIAANYTTGAKYGIVTFIGTGTDWRFLPLTDDMASGMTFQRVGNLFDTTRQDSFLIDNTPQICFYDGVTKSSEVFTDAKKLYCLTGDGIIKNSSTYTTTYTVLNTDQRIYVDSSSGAFTITLESNPVTNRELEIIDSVGSCGSNAVTIDGNGNSIIGSSTALMSENYIGFKLIFNGTSWNLN